MSYIDRGGEMHINYHEDKDFPPMIRSTVVDLI